MKSNANGAHAGVTLIELMIVVVIVAILASIALPSYQESVRKTRRSDAKVTLNETAQRLERCRTQFGSYDAAGCPLASPFNSAEGYYSVAVLRAAGSFTLTASAQAAQVSDARCATFALDHLGTRTATAGDGSAAPDCW
jgi:type IV pilus assembly protein PilE